MIKNLLPTTYHLQPEKGFTLIEVLIYLAVMAVVVPLLLNLFDVTVSSGALNREMRESRAEASRALQIMIQMVRNGSELKKPALGAGASELQIDDKRFFLESGQIKIEEGAAAVQPLTAAGFLVSDLQFSNFSRFGTAGLVTIRFKIKRGDYEKIYYGAAALRRN